MKYLRRYETIEEFEADYNGDNYLEPWTSLTKRKYLIGSDNVKYYLLGHFETEGIYSSAYIWRGWDEEYGMWSYCATEGLDMQMETPHQTSFEGGVYVVDNEYLLLKGEGTDYTVNYNKKRSDEKYIRIETTIDEHGGSEYSVVETNLTCEDLEETGNTYVVYMTIYEYETPDHTEVESTLVYNRDDDGTPVWNVEYDGCCMVGCNDGEMSVWYEG